MLGEHAWRSGNRRKTKLKPTQARSHHKGRLQGFGFVKHKKPILNEIAYVIAGENAPYTSVEKTDQTCYTENVPGGPRGRNAISLLQESKDINGYIHAQILSDLNSSPTKLSLQLDETTDVGSMSRLLVFFLKVEDICRFLMSSCFARN